MKSSLLMKIDVETLYPFIRKKSPRHIDPKIPSHVPPPPHLPSVILGRLLVYPLPSDRPAVDRSKVITPCFALHGWRSGPSPGFLLVLASRLSPRTKPLLVDLGVLHQQRALHWKGDPNPWLFSRSRLAVDVREQGVQLVDHLYHLDLPPCAFFASFFAAAEQECGLPLDRTTSDYPPFRFETKLAGHSNLSPLCCLISAMSDSTEILSLSGYLPRVLWSPTDSLASRNAPLHCGLLYSSVFSRCSFPSISPPVSPL